MTFHIAGASENPQSISEQTFNGPLKNSTTINSTNKSRKKTRHLISLKNARILPDIPAEDETILRGLFKKWTGNNW